MNRIGMAIISLIFWAGLQSATAFAASSPNLISYQGRLTNSSGTPITSAVNIEFRIYPTQASNTVLWSETQNGILPDAGLFNVNLGAVSPLTDAVFNGEERWLSIAIGGTEISRTRLTSVGYSHRVSTVDRARGGVISSSLTVEESSAKDPLVSPPSVNLVVTTDTAKLSLVPITNQFKIESPGNIQIPLKPGKEWLWEQLGGIGTPKITINPYAFSSAGFLSAYNGTDTIKFTSDPGDGGGFTCGSTGGPVIIRPGSGLFDIRNVAGGLLWRLASDGEFRCGSTGPIRIRPGGTPRITFTDTAGIETFSFDNTGEVRCASTGPVRIRPTKSKIFEILDTTGGPRFRFDDRRLIGLDAITSDTFLRLENGSESYMRGGLKLGLGGKLTATTGQFTGGLNVGFSSGAVDTFRLAVGDANFRLEANNINIPRLNWDINDWLGYSRATNIYSFNIGGASKMDVKSTGVDVQGDITASSSVNAGFQVQIGSDPNFYIKKFDASTPLINFDTDDFYKFNRTNNQHEIYVAGTARFFVTPSGACYVGTFGACSDRRFKKDIKPINHALDQVSQLQGVTHTWRVDEFPERGFAAGEQIGFIAQDVQKLFPSLVSKDGDGYLFVDYAKVTPLLVEAIKELKSQIASQDKVIAELHSEIAENGTLRADVNSLQAKLVAIEQMLAHSTNNANVVAAAAK